MKRLTTILGLTISVVGLTAGCSSDRGGAVDQYSSSVNGAEAYPQPAGSPSQRPGMNPQDPRDPQFGSRQDLLPESSTRRP